MADWSALAAAAPEIADPARSRLEATEIALLGTVRSDGRARISPVGPYFVDGNLIFGIMRSAKRLDLERDPRCVVHSPMSAGDGSEGEFKLYGRAIETADPGLVNAAGAWWSDLARSRYTVYRLDIDEAVAVTWDLAGGRMHLHRWTPSGGLQSTEREYP
jgi:hypothetical protein